MYCSLRNCYKEQCNEPENYNKFCLDHFQEWKQKLAEDQNNFEGKLKKNLESLSVLEEKIKNNEDIYKIIKESGIEGLKKRIRNNPEVGKGHSGSKNIRDG